MQTKSHLRTWKRNTWLLPFLFIWALQARGQDNALRENITLSMADVSLFDVVEAVSKQSRLVFSYDRSQLAAIKIKKVNWQAVSLGKVLTELKTLTGLEYALHNGTLALKAGRKPEPQKAPGKVAGRIVDEENNQPVAGATFRIGKSGIMTDENGAFSLDMPQGVYEAEVSSIGYGAKKITGIVVGERETFVLTVPLKRAKGQLGTVTVSAKRYRETGTSAAVIDEIRQADAVVSGISKEQISRSQDRDAAEVVRRIAGVSIIQNRLVVIRGLPQRYNTVMLNNMIAPSFEPDSRAFSFDVMPSGLIDRVMIYKTAVPELPGDFAGGVIKVYTTEMPVRNSFNISYAASYNANTTFRDFYEQPQGKKAWLGYDDGTYAMPAKAPTRIDMLSAGEQRTLTGEFNEHWDVHRQKAAPDQRFSLDFGRRIPLGHTSLLGVIGALSYSNTRQYSVVAQSTAGPMGDIFTRDYQFTDQSYDHNVRLNGMLNLSLEINKHHRIMVKQLYTHMGGTNAIVRKGETGDAASDGSGLYSGQYVRQYIMTNAIRGIYTGQLSGAHTLFGGTQLNWMAGYTKSRYDDPDQRYRTLKIDTAHYYNDTSLVEPAPGTISNIYRGRRYFKLPEEIKTGGADLVQPVRIANTVYTLKAGVFFEHKERTFEYRQLGYVTDTAIGRRITENYGKNNSYTAKNVLKAAYLAAEIPITSKLKVYGGLRIEDNLQELHTYTWKTVGIVNEGRIDLMRQHTSKLPSLNVSYALSGNSLVRAAYSRTLNRPEFREISNFFYLDMMTYRQAYGNEAMKIQTDIDNYDLRFEHYPGTGEMVTAGLFYKRFKNPVEFYYYAGTSGYNNFQWDNALSATSYGAEVELMLGMARYFNGGTAISKILQRTSALLNVAYIHSRVELGPRAGIQDKDRGLYGQSPYLVNAAVHYTDDGHGLKLNAGYNIIGKRLMVVGNLNSPNVYEMPRHSLDIGFSKKLGKIFELKGGVQNLLNARSLFIQTEKDIMKVVDGIDSAIGGDNIFQSSYSGAVFSLGAGLKL